METTLRSTAAGAAAATVALGICVLYFVVSLPVADGPDPGRAAAAPFVTGMAGLALAGAAVVRQQPRSTIGWLLVATGLAGAASRFSMGLALDLDASGSALVGAAGWVTNWAWVPAQALAVLLILRFPDGSLPGRGWRWVERAALAWLAVTVLATALVPGELGAQPLAEHDNPLGLAALYPVLDAVLAVVFTLAPILVVAAVAAPVVRWHGADAAERRQLRIVGAALLLIAVTAPLAIVSDAMAVLEGVAFLALPAAIAWAVLRHRLWDLELRQRFDRLRAVREEERARLQRELHDRLGPLLGSIGMRAEAARNLLGQDATERVSEVLLGIDDDTRAAVVEVRRIIDELGPSTLVESDLVSAVRALVVGYEAGPTFVLDLPAAPLGVAPVAEVVAYRVVAEAVRNVVRHAAATTCRIGVHLDGSALQVDVTDDGVGLQGHPEGVGRRSMAARVAAMGGTMDVVEARDGGVAVRAVLPGAVR